MFASDFLKEKGAEIKKRRKELGLTQKICADKIGVTQVG